MPSPPRPASPSLPSRRASKLQDSIVSPASSASSSPPTRKPQDHRRLDHSRRPPRPSPTGSPSPSRLGAHPRASRSPSPREPARDGSSGSLKSSHDAKTERVRVFVRIRPPLPSDHLAMRTEETMRRLVWIDGADATSPPLQFEFDGVLCATDGQERVYAEVAQPLVEAAGGGRTACLMCYGQTGTGKTYTFGGGEVLRNPSASPHGVVGRALRQLVEEGESLGLRLGMCYVQVYMEAVHDLIEPEASVLLREHPQVGVSLSGATWRWPTSYDEALATVVAADANRQTACTRMNIDSSRSHAVLLLTLRRSSTAENPIGEESEEAGLGRLYLVDLAGSERNKRSGAEASSQEFGEACAVNASLTTLGRCIQILAGKAKKGVSPPFRESKLTRILSPCLGVATTSLVCCVSASAADRSESVCTLEFGRNAMRVVVNPQRAAAVDYRVLAQELQTRLDLTLRRDFDLEAAIYARLSADFHEQLEEAEAARRKAELALHAERRGRTASAGGSASQCDEEGASAEQALVPMLANLCDPHRTGARGSAVEGGLRLSVSTPLITPAIPSPGSEAAYTDRSPVARALTVACAHDWDDIGLGSLRDSHPPTNTAEQCDVRSECTFASQDARQVLARHTTQTCGKEPQGSLPCQRSFAALAA
ncbi:hypothetical protein AB1Y20_022032 [Prymnesium parvum]|uniref:Kinesin-like protein n=1 Tax=Prymnesium parvum TaxID=97485 RepID=A0AB34JG31_PRYPA